MRSELNKADLDRHITGDYGKRGIVDIPRSNRPGRDAKKRGAFYCSLCKCKKPLPVRKCGGTGYARKGNGHKICYACCADMDRERMKKDGRIDLYLVKDSCDHWRVTNWPGTLRFSCGSTSKGRHNIAGSRVDCWFSGPDGFVWHGVQYGKWTEIVHCKRTKERIGK